MQPHKPFWMCPKHFYYYCQRSQLLFSTPQTLDATSGSGTNAIHNGQRVLLRYCPIVWNVCPHNDRVHERHIFVNGQQQRYIYIYISFERGCGRFDINFFSVQFISDTRGHKDNDIYSRPPRGYDLPRHGHKYICLTRRYSIENISHVIVCFFMIFLRPHVIDISNGEPNSRHGICIRDGI